MSRAVCVGIARSWVWAWVWAACGGRAVQSAAQDGAQLGPDAAPSSGPGTACPAAQVALPSTLGSGSLTGASIAADVCNATALITTQAPSAPVLRIEGGSVQFRAPDAAASREGVNAGFELPSASAGTYDEEQSCGAVDIDYELPRSRPASTSRCSPAKTIRSRRRRSAIGPTYVAHGTLVALLVGGTGRASSGDPKDGARPASLILSF